MSITPAGQPYTSAGRSLLRSLSARIGPATRSPATVSYPHSGAHHLHGTRVNIAKAMLSNLSSQRRAQIIVAVLMAVVGPVVAYVIDGLGFALFFLFLVGGGTALGYKFLPLPAPPPPSYVARPSVGTSDQAVRRRKNERLAFLASALPLAVLLAVLALIADPLAVRLAAAALAALLVAWAALGCWICSGRSDFWDGRRIRRHERLLKRLAEDRRLYEEHVDPVKERANMAKLNANMAKFALLPLALLAIEVAGLIILAPVLLAHQSSSSAVRTIGAVVSGILLAGTLGLLVFALLRWWRRRGRAGRKSIWT